MLPPLTFSKVQIIFTTIYQSPQLFITNHTDDSIFYFKVKLRKNNFYSLYPTTGAIKPQQTKKIIFKAEQSFFSQKQLRKSEQIGKKDDFKIEVLRVYEEGKPKSKRQLQRLWEQKKKEGNMAFNKFNFTIVLKNNIKKEEQGKQYINQYSRAITKQTNSSIKSQCRYQNSFFNGQRKISKQEYNQKLSIRFQILKDKQEQLKNARDQAYLQNIETECNGRTKKTPILSILLLIAIFLFGVVIGNYLKLRVLV